MARRFSHSRTQRPLWLVIVIAIGGWVYKNYVQPHSTANRSELPSTKSGSNSGSTSSSKPARTPIGGGTAQAQGGVLFRDHVIKVTDGDTVKLAAQGSVRLIGVDCPEKAQPGGQQATEFATKYLLDQDVEVELCAKQPTDRYGRGLGMIYVRRNGQRILFNAELVRQGYARVYSLRPCTVDEAQWNGYYEEARSNNRGLFRTLGNVPDAAAYRKKKRSSLLPHEWPLGFRGTELTFNFEWEKHAASTCGLGA